MDKPSFSDIKDELLKGATGTLEGVESVRDFDNLVTATYAEAEKRTFFKYAQEANAIVFMHYAGTSTFFYELAMKIQADPEHHNRNYTVVDGVLSLALAEARGKFYLFALWQEETEAKTWIQKNYPEKVIHNGWESFLETL